MNTLRSLFILLFILAFFIGCETSTDTKPVEKPKETITLERAHEMFVAYQERYKALTEFRGGKEDAKFGWHTLDFYKNYIAYLEQEAKKVKMKVSGLRLYYVAYPNDEKSGNHADYQTYIFVPTYYDEKTQSHVAFDPLHVDENGTPLRIHDIITTGESNRDPQKVSMLLTRSQNERQSSIANMASMCEPNCGSTY